MSTGHLNRAAIRFDDMQAPGYEGFVLLTRYGLKPHLDGTSKPYSQILALLYLKEDLWQVWLPDEQGDFQASDIQGESYLQVEKRVLERLNISTHELL